MSDEHARVRQELASVFEGLLDGDRQKLDGLIALGDAAHPEDCPWREVAATLIARRLESLMGGFSFALLAALQHGELDARAVAESVIADEPARPSSGPVRVEDDWRAERWQTAPLAVRKLLERIAESLLDVQTLRTRNRDSLDFHSVHVNNLRRALLVAYLHGAQDTPPK